MKKITLLTFILSSILSCSSSKTISNNGNAVGIRQKTSNPNTPYIYKNGYKNFEIIPISTISDNDSTYISELRFNAVFSAMYTKKLMYDKYGKWDKEVWPNGANRPILIWEKRKLIESQNDLYSVATNGTESRKEMFASAIVLDSKNRDCLTENYEARDLLIDFFATGIRNLSSDKEFYDVYWSIVKEHNETR